MQAVHLLLRDGKGGIDHVTLLPGRVRTGLGEHLREPERPTLPTALDARRVRLQPVRPALNCWVCSII